MNCDTRGLPSELVNKPKVKYPILSVSQNFMTSLQIKDKGIYGLYINIIGIFVANKLY